MDRSRHTVTKYPTDEKTLAAFDSNLFEILDHVNNSLYEVQLAKAQIEHKDAFLVGFFILQYAKLRMLELYDNFFTKFCGVNKFEELEMDTDSLYLALAEKEPVNCIRPEVRAEWQRLRSNDCVNSFTADAYSKVITLIQSLSLVLRVFIFQMYSLVNKIQIDPSKAVELVNTIPMLEFNNGLVEVVFVDSDPNNISLLINNTFFQIKFHTSFYNTYYQF